MSTIPATVCWYEGMAMLPQHFQLQALRHETLAATLAHDANPWFWGVHQLQIDEAALCAGTLRLLRLQAVMPDGAPIDYDISQDPPLEFDCTTLLPASPGSEHPLYLALPPAQRAGQWQTMEGRYRSVHSAPLPDLSSGEFPESIPLWKAAPRIVSHNERADQVCLPLLQVEYTEGGFRQNAWFAPSPVVKEGDYLSQRTRKICRQAREKMLFLGREIALAQQNQRTTDWLWLTLALQSVQGALPLLESLVNSSHTHPLSLFRSICVFTGQTAILAPDKALPVLPAFNYQNMLPGFNSLFTLLESQLAQIHRRHQRLNFILQQNAFLIELPSSLSAGDTLTVGVMMPVTATLGAEAWLRQCIIASEPFLPILRRQRMHGMSIAPLPAEKRGDWETDTAIALFTLTLSAQWFEENTPLYIAPLHEVADNPARVMLYRQEAPRDASDD
ncbi:MAG: type VI secretion system baseplate subunit TssK [Kluyvera sp.]|uniref:type VI secretion system baseplate subunit TssK n=1 Tax=Kluyvera sp. TaxID=1538228 RepID=UPI003F2C7A0F